MKPTIIAFELFHSKSKMRVKKVASGSHHTLALTECGKVYGWGDSESGKIGRMLNTRNKFSQALKIEKVGAKNAIDVFCGNQHSFYINDKHQVFSWGLNNHGQLGIGSKNNTAAPTRIKDIDPFEGDYVVELAGGEHHSIARTKKGLVYCWGRNDEGQCGIGDTYGDYRKQKAQEDMEKAAKLEEEKKAEEEKKKAEEEAAKKAQEEAAAAATTTAVEGAVVVEGEKPAAEVESSQVAVKKTAKKPA